jgi:hypothetical protein
MTRLLLYVSIARLSRARLFSSHLELPRIESVAMRTKIYPWIILCAVLSVVILYAQPDLYKDARIAIEILKWDLILAAEELIYGPPNYCGGF